MAPADDAQSPRIIKLDLPQTLYGVLMALGITSASTGYYEVLSNGSTQIQVWHLVSLGLLGLAVILIGTRFYWSVETIRLAAEHSESGGAIKVPGVARTVMGLHIPILIIQSAIYFVLGADYGDVLHRAYHLNGTAKPENLDFQLLTALSIILLFWNAIWLALHLLFWRGGSGNESIEGVEWAWIVNNAIFGLMLIGFYFAAPQSWSIFVYAAVVGGLLFLNSAIDFLIAARFYIRGKYP